MFNRVEVWYNQQRMLDWFVTTKLPVFDKQGRTIGIIGITRSYGSKLKSQHATISRAIEHARAHRFTRVTVAKLARICGMSERQLHRKFIQEFGLSVSVFLLKTRIHAASEALLEKNASIAKISADFGFCDQSAFTRQFRNHTGLTPRAFRSNYSMGQTRQK